MDGRERIAGILSRVWRRVSFVAAAAFLWGGLEASLNRFWPPAGTYRPSSLLESLHSRVLFYGVLVAAGSLVIGGGSFVFRKLARRPRAERRVWPAAAALAFGLAANAGWLVAGLDARAAAVRVGPFTFDLRLGGPFLLYWALWAGVGLLGTVLFAARAARWKWLPSAARTARTALAAAFVLAFGLHPLLRVIRPVPRGPDIIFILLDAWRADALDAETMPNAESFATSVAVYYPRTWACATWTLPSMGSIFTGRYPDMHGGRAGPVADRLSPTVAQILYRAGYDTAAIGANRLLDRHNPIAAGFHDFYFWDWWPPLRWIGFYDTDWYGPAVRDALHTRALGPATSRALTRALERYVARPHPRPYFLWVHYMDPHGPYTPPPGYRLKGDEPYMSADRAVEPARFGAYRRLYMDECRYLDDLLAPTLARVAASPRTALVLTGDHGEEFWEHGLGNHGGSVYEAACRVPLVIRYPGVAPLLDPTPASHIDLAPTFLALAGIKPAPSMVGEALYPAGEGPTEKAIFVGSANVKWAAERPRRDAAIRWPRKIIVANPPGAAPAEYYDVALDPYEQRPLPEDAYARILRRDLAAWRAANTRLAGGGEPTTAADAQDLKALGYVK